MTRRRAGVLVLAAMLAVTAATAAANGKLRGWVTRVDNASQTAVIGGQPVSLRGLEVTGGPLEPGVFAKVEKGRIKVKPQRPPADDEVVHYPAKDPRNPGRVVFSHLRHFAALGAKDCKACHSPEMKLLDTAPRTVASTSEPHGATSRGRFCASCHDGRKPMPTIAAADTVVFTTAKTRDAASCQRCHAPADHGVDFTARHGDIAEHGGGVTCATCHRQSWTAKDRELQSALLAAERIRKSTPDDPKAALAVGPNNFCVHCHRTDAKWRE